MYRSRTSLAPEFARRGIILLVVLSLLALFAIVGVSFVLYATAEADASRISREAESQSQPNMEPELLLGIYLNQLLFDSPDTASGVYSSMRGHSLARLMWGGSGGPNAGAFNGWGRLHTGPGTYMNPFGIDDYLLINYTFFPNDPQFLADGTTRVPQFIRDPEFINPAPTNPPAAPRPVPYRRNLSDTKGPFVGGFNVSYTYPDVNNMFLAAVKADGTILLPSFHRPYLFGSLADRNNPNWRNAEGKYLTLRPRPIDQKKNPNDPNEPELFPYPEDEGGDVKNLLGAPGGNDSIWMDLGVPVMVTPDGRKFKPLFAPLITDLDNRANLNVHGNLRARSGTTYNHASHQGWGPWEVNVGRVLALPTSPNEWKNLFLGRQINIPQTTPTATAKLLEGRYGPDTKPNGTILSTISTTGRTHYYSQIDYDGTRLNGTNYVLPTARLQLPTGLANFPTYPNHYENWGAAESADHPQRYNLNSPGNPYSVTNDDRKFRLSNLEKLYRYNDTGMEMITTELMRLCPNNFSDPRIRHLITLLSYDVRNPGYTPYVHNLPNANQYPAPGSQLGQAPLGSPIPYPDLTARYNTTPGGEFNTASWRATTPTARIDLNRTLTAYPITANGLPPNPGTPTTLVATTGYNGRFDMVRVVSDTWPGVARPNWAPAAPNPWNRDVFDNLKASFKRAQNDRQAFAKALYDRLVVITGLRTIPLGPGTGQSANPSENDLAPRRWLAQLAVNIVDYIDEDDISTVFNFYSEANAYPNGLWTAYDPNQPDTAPRPGFRRIRPGVVDPPFDAEAPLDPNNPNSPPRYWVIGTELPKVTLSEVLVEYTPQGNPQPNQILNAKVWVELQTTMQRPGNSTDGSITDGHPVPLFVPEIPPTYATNPYLPRDPRWPDTPTVSISQVGQAAGDVGTDTAAGLTFDPNRRKGYGPYKVVLTKNITQGPSFPDAETNDQDFGDPLKTRTIAGQAQAPKLNGYITTPYIDVKDLSLPAQQQGNPYFLIGPRRAGQTGTPARDVHDSRDTIRSVTSGGTVPNNTPVLQTPNMEHKVRIGSNGQPEPMTVLLRRLANPHLPPSQPAERSRQTVTVPTASGTQDIQNVEFIATSPTWFNPYVTVDYMEGNVAQDTRDPDRTYRSRGKRQPFSSALLPPNPALDPPDVFVPVMEQQLTAANPPKTIHTFGLPNNPGPQLPNPDATQPPLPRGNEWLVHLDRKLISPLELLHVSAYPPDQLTQKFTGEPSPNGSLRQGHNAPWLDQRTRLYRLFEFLETNNLPTTWTSTSGTSGNRVPGRININTIWDPEVFRALCDAQGANHFTPNEVERIYQELVGSRSPNLLGGGALGPNDRPFKGFATGFSLKGGDPQHPDRATGINDTFLRSALPGADGSGTDPTSDGGANTPRLFQVQGLPPDSAQPPLPPHPYVRAELMNKIYNQTTIRSNVFAVFLTVGFFEVTDDTTSPPKLGAEIGRAENRHVRHRMFAIVDRSTLAGTQAPRTSFIPRDNNTFVPYFSIINDKQ